MKGVTTQAGRNGGRLKVGNHGNKGGGRIKDDLRVQLVESFELGLAKLRERLQRDDLTTGELVRVVDLMGKYAHPCLHQPEERDADLLKWIQSAGIEELREWARRDARNEPYVVTIGWDDEPRPWLNDGDQWDLADARSLGR